MTSAATASIQSTNLARNALINLLGQGLPLLVALLAVPPVVHGLGPGRFGLLSLAWAVLGYFTVFDLGLGRATTKFVAEALGAGDHDRVGEIAWSTLIAQAVLGVLGGLSLVALTPLLVARVLHLPPELEGEARATFYIIGAAVPTM